MTLTAQELRTRMSMFRDALKKAGLKLTHQRLEVFREVASSENHPDAEKVFLNVRKRLPTISLDTVYRTLGTLNELKVIEVLGLSRECVRYDGNKSPHHHFICTVCGSITDFVFEEYNQLTIPSSVMLLGEVDKTRVEMQGRCINCINKG